jgi:hypothetical protein
VSRLTFTLLAAGALALIWTPYLAKAQTTAAPAVPAAAPAADSGPSAICTDRPTKASNACTVDPGVFQVEADLFNGAFQHANGVTTDTYLVTNPTLKYGLTKTLDIEANIAPYEVVRTHDSTGTHTESGIGDLYLRLKDEIYSSADGNTQIGLYPYLKAPTARHGVGNGAVEGGVVVPVNLKLNDKVTLTFAPEADAFKDAVGSGRHFNTAQVINVGYSLPNDYTVYGEVWGDWNFDPTGTVRQYSLDFAVAKLVNKSFQLDGGVNFGLNRATPGVQVYVGVSKKY